MSDDQVEVLNVNTPGRVSRVDGARYRNMRHAIERVLPKRAPGFTHAELMAAIAPCLDDELFPGGAKRGWWSKTVQLDLEARGELVREDTKPLRWHRP